MDITSGLLLGAVVSLPTLYVALLYVGARRERREAEARTQAVENRMATLEQRGSSDATNRREPSPYVPRAFVGQVWLLYDSANERVTVNCIVAVIGDRSVASVPPKLMLSTAERGAPPSVAQLCVLDLVGAREILPAVTAHTYTGVIFPESKRAMITAVRDAMNKKKGPLPSGQLFAKVLVRVDESPLWSPVGVTSDPHGYELFVRIDNWYAVPETWSLPDA